MEPKKACLTWLIMYRAIWTQKKAFQFGIGNGKCARCGLEEDDIHIFLQCNSIVHLIAKINGYIACGGRGSISWKQLLLGETIGCSIELWTIIRTKILWFLWIERLSAIFQGATRNSSSLQQCLVAVGERYYSKKHNLLSSRIETLQRKIAILPTKQELRDELDQACLRLFSFVNMDLSYVLKLQHL